MTRVCGAHLDFLAVNLDQPLPEVHPDRGLGLLGEPARTEAVGEAGLPDPRVPDHDDLEDAGPRRRKSRARQRAGEFNRRPDLGHIRPTGWTTRICRESSGSRTSQDHVPAAARTAQRLTDVQKNTFTCRGRSGGVDTHTVSLSRTSASQ